MESEINCRILETTEASRSIHALPQDGEDISQKKNYLS
jgi:hypothetical protein